MNHQRPEHAEQGHRHHGSALDGLQQEAAADLSSEVHRKSRRLQPLELDSKGQYEVQPGDTLWKIAKRSLAGKGQNTKDEEAVWDEMSHIATDNLVDHPEIYFDPHALKPGMVLKIEGTRTGRHNDENGCEQRNYESTHGQKVAGACDTVTALPGAKVVLHQGSEATVTRGATGFGFPGSKARVLAGGRFIAAGGEVQVEDGAMVMQAAPSEIVAMKTPN